MSEINSQGLRRPPVEPGLGVAFEINGTLLTRYSGAGSHVIVPSGIKTIGKESFAGKLFLKGIVIPNTVISIEEKAFWGCKNLQNVVLGSEIKSIGSYAFADCTGIKSINIPSSLESIGAYAFSYVFGDGGKIKQPAQDPYYAELPKSIQSLGAGSFLGCDGLVVYQTLSNPGRALYDPEKESGHWADSLRFKPHVIFIRSVQTEQLLCAVWMPSRDEKREHLNEMMDFWGNHSSFDFGCYDELFGAMISPEDKIHMAFYRLFYPHLLAEQHRTVYAAFLKRQAVKATQIISSNHTLDLLQLMAKNDMITKENVESIFDVVNAAGNTKHIAWIMNYKEKSFSLNENRLML